MKSILKFAAAAILGGIILTSCHKDKNDIPQNVEKKITLNQMENPDNPYDEQGKIHNEFLDYAAEAIDIGSTKEMTSKATLDLVKRFYTSQQMDFDARQMKAYEELFRNYAESGIGNDGGVIALKSRWCEYFPGLCDVLKTCLPTFLLSKTNGGTPTGRTLKFIDSVKQVERKILLDKDYTDKERKTLLTLTSVARFSAGYWHNVTKIEKGNSPYYKSIQAPALSDCPTCDIVMGDAVGAAVGTIIPAVGTGTGAAIGSLAVATAKVINWLWD